MRTRYTNCNIICTLYGQIKITPNKVINKLKIRRGPRWRKWMPLSVDPLRWLQSMSSRTNVASNTITVHLISSIHLSAFLSSPVWSKLAELSFKIRQHLTIFATRRHLWFHFSLGVPALNCKYPQNGADWLTNMSFLVIPIYILNTYAIKPSIWLNEGPNGSLHLPDCLRMAERGWANSRSCISRWCRSSNSWRRTFASAASSGGSTATMLSSMSASTCCRRDGGSDWMKPAGSTGTSALSVLDCTASLACSARCWANTYRGQHRWQVEWMNK